MQNILSISVHKSSLISLLFVFISNFITVQAKVLEVKQNAGQPIKACIDVAGPTPTSIAANNTQVDFFKTSSSLLSCNEASLRWLSTVTYTGNITSLTSTGCSSCTVTYITPENAVPYTTLCDGTPRAHGSATWTWLDRATSTFNLTISAVVTPSTGSDMPQCTFDAQQCTQLYSHAGSVYSDELESYTSITKAGSSANSPLYTKPACLSTFDLGSCNPSKCYLYGGPIQLAYWPVSVVGDLCGNKTTISSSINSPLTATTFGTTVVSPQVLVSLSTLYAVDGCGTTIGKPLSNFLLPQHPDQISTQCMTYHAGFRLGEQINFADFNSPVPATAYNCQPQCNGGEDAFGHFDYCSTFYDDFNPYLAFPTDIWSIQPGWSTCSFDYDGNVLSDPPVALTPASYMRAATTRPLIFTTTQAIPASSASSVASSTSSLTVPAIDPLQQSSHVQIANKPTSTSITVIVTTFSMVVSDADFSTQTKSLDLGSHNQDIAHTITLDMSATNNTLTAYTGRLFMDTTDSAIIIDSTLTVKIGEAIAVHGQTVAVKSDAVVFDRTTIPLSRIEAPSMPIDSILNLQSNTQTDIASSSSSSTTPFGTVIGNMNSRTSNQAVATNSSTSTHLTASRSIAGVTATPAISQISAADVQNTASWCGLWSIILMLSVVVMH